VESRKSNAVRVASGASGTCKVIMSDGSVC
jgi:hypothetical protein